VIALDGLNRIECTAEALSELTDDGVLIWDDTNRHSGDEDEHLLKARFQKLPLSGLSTLGPEYTQTTIYYRDDNCLGI